MIRSLGTSCSRKPKILIKFARTLTFLVKGAAEVAKMSAGLG
jgi:hypothetical protein